MRIRFSFALLLLAFRLFAGVALASDWPDQLTVYAVPAPRGIDWRSPRRLLLHGATNGINWKHLRDKQAIGHVVVEVRSSLTGRHELTGMNVSGRYEQVQLVALDAYGLGIMTADMMGRLETPEELRPKLKARQKTGLVSHLRVLLKPEAAARMIAWLDEYRARKMDQHYGGANRPLYGEGAGCSAFGVAFLQTAGLMEPEYEAWRVHFRIPRSLVGGPLTNQRVQAVRVLGWGRWAREEEPHVPMMFWDPSLMHEWIVATWDAERAQPTGRWTPEQVKRSRGLVVDARDRPVPTGPLFLHDPQGAPHPYGLQESVRRVPMAAVE